MSPLPYHSSSICTGTFVALATVIILIVRFAVTEFAYRKAAWNTGLHLKQIVNFIITGVTVLVVAVPEGLPLAVTLALAYSVKKMMKVSTYFSALSIHSKEIPQTLISTETSYLFIVIFFNT
ncbi:unnamed protein product [Protopolystoma xenopodis]|uniref:Cation-transporting P-type ATPase C-terminal domain-containing protein n=1 Tax=Protopolystoma xenopodis TaxID=117903 RepID=A0A448WWM2_9PLAT|nr:unnamed protein product [Protopolystoma xenopodis]